MQESIEREYEDQLCASMMARDMQSTFMGSFAYPGSSSRQNLSNTANPALAPDSLDDFLSGLMPLTPSATVTATQNTTAMPSTSTPIGISPIQYPCQAPGTASTPAAVFNHPSAPSEVTASTRKALATSTSDNIAEVHAESTVSDNSQTPASENIPDTNTRQLRSKVTHDDSGPKKKRKIATKLV